MNDFKALNPKNTVDGSGHKFLTDVPAGGPNGFLSAVRRGGDILKRQQAAEPVTKRVKRGPSEMGNARISEQQLPMMPGTRNWYARQQPGSILNKMGFLEHDRPAPDMRDLALTGIPVKTWHSEAVNPPKQSHITVRLSCKLRPLDYGGGVSSTQIFNKINSRLPVFIQSTDYNFYQTQQSDPLEITNVTVSATNADSMYMLDVGLLNQELWIHRKKPYYQDPLDILSRWRLAGLLDRVDDDVMPSSRTHADFVHATYIHSGEAIHEGTQIKIVNIWLLCPEIPDVGYNLWFRLVRRTHGMEDEEVDAQDNMRLHKLTTPYQDPMSVYTYVTLMQKYNIKKPLVHYYRLEPVATRSNSFLPHYLYNGPGWKGNAIYFGFISSDCQHTQQGARFNTAIKRLIYPNIFKNQDSPVRNMARIPTITSVNINRRIHGRFI